MRVYSLFEAGIDLELGMRPAGPKFEGPGYNWSTYTEWLGTGPEPPPISYQILGN